MSALDTPLDSPFDTVVIGAGQAGLALGHHLQRAGRRFVLVDGAARVGDSWRHRWDSLTLFTPRRYDTLPGLPFPGDPEGCPGKDEVADYLELYAASQDLPVRLSSAVGSVRHDGPGRFVVEAGGDTLEARQVVVASGGFTGPAVPGFAGWLDERIVQLHSSDYRNPSSVPEGEVLVVGAGNTGVQLAQELADAGRLVSMAVSTPPRAVPARLLGRSFFWWLELLHGMDAGPDTRLGRRLRNDTTVLGTDLKALFRRVERLPRVMDADHAGVLLADGRRRRPDVVLWATGYRPSYPWLHVPVLDAGGVPIQHHGVTDVPGLAFLGMPWQRSRGSALLGWVGRDAALLADRLGAQLPARGPVLIP
jgi:putative flavoprotein involved in K+ transport